MFSSCTVAVPLRFWMIVEFPCKHRNSRRSSKLLVSSTDRSPFPTLQTNMKVRVPIQDVVKKKGGVVFLVLWFTFGPGSGKNSSAVSHTGAIGKENNEEPQAISNHIKADSFMSAEDCFSQLEERIKEYHRVTQFPFSIYKT